MGVFFYIIKIITIFARFHFKKSPIPPIQYIDFYTEDYTDNHGQ